MTTKGFLSRNAKKNLFIAGMLLIPVVHFIIFYGVVNFNSILMAFQRLSPDTGKNVFSWANFSELWMQLFKNKDSVSGKDMRAAFLNTSLTFGLMIFFLPWGFFITYFLYKKIPLGGFWRTMLFIPTILPAMAMTSIFRNLVHPKGLFGSIWTLFGSQAPFFMTDPNLSRWTILGYIFWTNFGGQFILFMGAMSRIPKEVIESARLDGAGMRKEMLKIVLPLCWPTFSMLLLLNIAGFFVASGPVLLLTPSRSTNTISYIIFSDTRGGLYYKAAALGVACTVILFPIVLLSRWALGKAYANVEF